MTSNEYHVDITVKGNLLHENPMACKLSGDYFYILSLLDESKAYGTKTNVDVVTFVGLIYNCLVRMSYECHSVVDHWAKSK